MLLCSSSSAVIVVYAFLGVVIASPVGLHSRPDGDGAVEGPAKGVSLRFKVAIYSTTLWLIKLNLNQRCSKFTQECFVDTKTYGGCASLAQVCSLPFLWPATIPLTHSRSALQITTHAPWTSKRWRGSPTRVSSANRAWGLSDETGLHCLKRDRMAQEQRRQCRRSRWQRQGLCDHE